MTKICMYLSRSRHRRFLGGLICVYLCLFYVHHLTSVSIIWLPAKQLFLISTWLFPYVFQIMDTDNWYNTQIEPEILAVPPCSRMRRWWHWWRLVTLTTWMRTCMTSFLLTTPSPSMTTSVPPAPMCQCSSSAGRPWMTQMLVRYQRKTKQIAISFLYICYSIYGWQGLSSLLGQSESLLSTLIIKVNLYFQHWYSKSVSTFNIDNQSSSLLSTLIIKVSLYFQHW